MDESFTPLGAIERHIVDEITKAIDEAKTGAEKIIEILDGIDPDWIAPAVLDAERKQVVVALVAPLQGLANNLQQGMLGPLLAQAMLKPPERTEAQT